MAIPSGFGGFINNKDQLNQINEQSILSNTIALNDITYSRIQDSLPFYDKTLENTRALQNQINHSGNIVKIFKLIFLISAVSSVILANFQPYERTYSNDRFATANLVRHHNTRSHQGIDFIKTLHIAFFMTLTFSLFNGILHSIYACWNSRIMSRENELNNIQLRLHDFSNSFQALKVHGERKVTGIFLKYEVILKDLYSKKLSDFIDVDELSKLSTFGKICLMDGIAKIFVNHNVKSELPNEWNAELNAIQSNSNYIPQNNIWKAFMLTSPDVKATLEFAKSPSNLNTAEFDQWLFQIFNNAMSEHEDL